MLLISARMSAIEVPLPSLLLQRMKNSAICPEQERPLWQGLAQLCVALTHAERGNAVGARRLLDRAAGHLGAYADGDPPTYGLDLDEVLACARRRVQG